MADAWGPQPTKKLICTPQDVKQRPCSPSQPVATHRELGRHRGSGAFTMPHCRSRRSPQKAKGEARASLTDPQARKMQMGDGGFRPAYNVQFTADTESQFVEKPDFFTSPTSREPT